MFNFQKESELDRLYRELDNSENLSVAEVEELLYRINYLEQELDLETQE